MRRSAALIVPALLVLAACSSSAAVAREAGPIPIVVGTKASPLERLAGRELAEMLGKLYPKQRFVVAGELPAKGRAVLLGTPVGVPQAPDVLKKDALQAAGSFVVTTVRQEGRELGLIVGADPRAVRHAVYALLEELGCGFYLSYDAVGAAGGRPFDFRRWNLKDAPLAAERIVLNWHNFLSSCSTWNLPQWQHWIRQVAKMRFTGIMVHAYGNNPMVCYTHNGQTKPVGYLSTTAKGRDWGTQHVNDVRKLTGAQGWGKPGDKDFRPPMFAGAVFGAKAALVPDDQRVAAAKKLMKQAFAFAEARGVDVVFALDVDTASSNPPNVIRTLPASARLTSGGHALANPDTPAGYAYYKTQADSLLGDYPQIDRLVIWFRSGRTPWRRLAVKDFPDGWKAEYEAALAKSPGAAKHRDRASMFAISRIVRAFRKALDEGGRRDVKLGIGTWGFGHMPAADAFMPPEVAFYCLDAGIQFAAPALRRHIRATAARRPVVPIVWAHHDDRTYIGRPYTPFAKFATRLKDCRAAGFGIIHWTTRPLDLYFTSLARQVWRRTADEPLAETCRDMAERCFGADLREPLGTYLLEWVTRAPQFGRETSDRFIDRPLADPETTVAQCRKRQAMLKAVDAARLDPAARKRLEYFKLLEKFFVEFYKDEGALQKSRALLARGDLRGADNAIRRTWPASVINTYAKAARTHDISLGEKALLISLNLRWLPYLRAQRQAVGNYDARFNFQATQHDPLAQGAGRRTFHIDRDGRIWLGLGQKETGVEVRKLAVDQQGDRRTLDEEICETGIESDRPIRLRLSTFVGGRLVPGEYHVHLLTADPDSKKAGQRVFDVELRGSRTSASSVESRAKPVTDRVDVFERAKGARKALRLTHPVQIEQGTLEVLLKPVRGRAILCGVIIQPKKIRQPPPMVRQRDASELVPAAVTASGSVSARHSPARTTDLDFRTRWAVEGRDDWIRYDLGRPKLVNHLMIAWFNGDGRKAKFAVEVSDDAKTWKQVFAGQSGGTTRRLEKVDFEGVKTRYVRVVCRGNSANAWNSITEAAVYGEYKRPTRLPGR